MDASNPALSAENLLEHQGFVRSVARGLLRDEHAAEDVAQDTLVAALGRFPAAPAALRGWLGTVARNRALDARRRTVHRERRERANARDEALPSVDTAFERLAVQRDVVGSILELDEPYRSVVILRYYHDLEPTEIARRLKANPSTVRTQLVRAHELLRKRLDARHGRESWAALLLADPAARSGVGVTTAAVGAVVLASAAILWWSWPSAPSSTALGAPAIVAAAPTEASSELMPIAPVEPESPREEAGQSPRTEVRDFVEHFPRAELLDRTEHDDYEKATFSFEHGLRDDPWMRMTRNDWDVLFQSNALQARTVTDDQSVIVDLGPGRLSELRDDENVRSLVKAAGLLRQASDRTDEDTRELEESPAQAGHCYLVWTRDRNTDLVSVFEVLELAPGDRCVLEWFCTHDGSSARASATVSDPAALARTLVQLRALLLEGGKLRGPYVLLQARNGTNGTARLNAAGQRDCIERSSDRLLDLLAPVDTSEGSSAHVEGTGFIPGGQRFLLTRATWQGNGRGGFRIFVKGTVLVDQGSTPDPVAGAWVGEIVLAPGDEDEVFLELRTASVGEVVLQGSLVPAPGGANAPAVEPEPELDRKEAAQPLVRVSPRAELFDRQGRNAHGMSMFSFERGIGGDQRVARDFDVLFVRNGFEARTAVDEHSVIVDLGTVSLAGLGADAHARERVEAAALVQQRRVEPEKLQRSEAALHRSYLVWTCDSDSDTDRVAAFEIVELEPGARCVLEWFSVRGSRVRASIELADAGAVASALVQMGDVLEKALPAPGPRIVLQGRNGAGGGNPFRVDIAGKLRYFHALSTKPLDLATPVEMHEDSVAYVENGGFLQDGQVFVVQRVAWSGEIAGDGNGPGGFRVVLKQLVLAEHRVCPERLAGGETAPPEPVQGVWTGRVELGPGDEERVFLEINNSSKGEVVIEGSLETALR